MSPMALARSSSVSIAMRYVVAILWRTSRFPMVGRIAYFNTESDVYECLVIVAVIIRNM